MMTMEDSINTVNFITLWRGVLVLKHGHMSD